MRIALASSYGLRGSGVERAFDAGISWFFWGALRHADFGAALRRLAQHRRHELAIATVSYAKHPLALRLSVASARRALRIDALDLLVLGYANASLSPRLVDAALELRASGAVKAIGVSSHDRAWLAATAASPWPDAVMARYSAAHPGAEHDVFPSCGGKRLLTYTATRWGTLLDPTRTPERDAVPTASDCYRFVLSHPSVDLCLAAPSDDQELRAALDAGRRGPLSTDELTWMRRVGAHVRATARLPEPRAKTVTRATAALRSLWNNGVTEDLISRFNR